MNFFCPQCGAMVAAADVDLAAGVAKCGKCQNVFSCAEIVRRELGTRRQPPPRAQSSGLLTPRPSKMRVEERGGTWSISWRWFAPVHIFLIFFCAIWDGFLLVWYSGALRMHAGRGPDLLMILFPVLHVVVGVTLSYYTLCGLFNRTCVSIDSLELTIVHGPLPWRGARVPRSHLRQLFCKQMFSRGRNSDATSYNLMAVLTDGSEIALLSALPDASQPKFLEQELERRLGIVDEPVVGEHA